MRQDAITDSNALQFEREGFLGPFDLPPAALSAWDASQLSEVSARLRQQNPYVVRNQHIYSKSLVNLVTNDSILDKVKALLGTDTVLLWVAHVLERKPGSEGQTWHVDGINMLTRSLHVTIALTDMNSKNGCLRAIPHSHLYRLNFGARDPIPGDADVSQLANSVAPWHSPNAVIDLEVKAGQFFFTWGGLWHSVGRNETNSSRFAIVARFGRPDIALREYKNEIQGSLMPCILVSGEDSYGLNDIRPYPKRDVLVEDGYNPVNPVAKPPSLLGKIKRKLRLDQAA